MLPTSPINTFAGDQLCLRKPRLLAAIARATQNTNQVCVLAESHIQPSAALNAGARVELQMIAGRNLSSFENLEAGQIHELDVEGFPHGVYILEVFDGSYLFTEQILL